MQRLVTTDSALPGRQQILPPQKPIGSIAYLISRLRFEAAVLVLLLSTFAAIHYENFFTSKTFAITPANLARFEPYWYDDRGNGGNSTITPTPGHPLNWSCELRTGFAYPYCGFGLLFDKGSIGRGTDLSKFQTATLKLRYSGSAGKIRLTLKNYDPRYSKGPSGVKPNEVEAVIAPGESTVRINLEDAVVAPWWIVQNKLTPELTQPQFDNVSAIEIHPAAGTMTGHHQFELESIVFESKQLSQAQWYLVLLAAWVVLIAAWLISRIVQIRRAYERRHRRQVHESEELKAAKTLAEGASAAKSAFLANMSHELRTPLNAILGYAQLLERERLSERQTLAARTIHQSGSHLLTLITDILDLSKIEAGRLELEHRTFDLHACVTGVANMMRNRCDEKGLGFRCTIAPDVPKLIESDEKRLRQVLINLLGNAVKFTSEGELWLDATLSGTNAGRARVRIEVGDTGMGISPEAAARIFEPFEQAGDAANKASGTGLGLSISRRIVELMGGSLAVESQPGQGSRFFFEAMFDLAEDSAAPSDRADLTGYRGKRRAILVADDDEANRTLLVTTLRELGFETVEACDGQEATEIAQSHRLDLAIIGLKMPRMDGDEVARRIREGTLRELPILAYSANADEASRDRMIDAGADGFLATPVSLDDLMRQLETRLGLEWVERAPGDPMPSAAAPSEEMAVPPSAELERLVQLARAGNMRAIRAFAEELSSIDARYAPFTARLKELAAAYQSPAILDLASRHLDKRKAA